MNSSYAGNRHSGAVERSMVSSRGRGLPSTSIGSSTTNSSPMINTSPSVGSSASIGLPTRPIPSYTASALTVTAAGVSPSVVTSFGIPPLVDPHNGMDQMVPDFHGGLGVSEKY